MDITTFLIVAAVLLFLVFRPHKKAKDKKDFKGFDNNKKGEGSEKFEKK